MPRRPVILFAAACAVIALALGLITMVVVKGREQSAQIAAETGTGQPTVGGPFTLTNQAVTRVALNRSSSLSLSRAIRAPPRQ